MVKLTAFPVTSIARSPPSLILSESTTLREAISKMSMKSVRHAIVSNDGKRMLGIVSAKDFMNYLGGGEKSRLMEQLHGGDILRALNSPIAPIVNKKPITDSMSASLPDLMAHMAKYDIGMLPLLDAEGLVWGILSERHLFRLFEDGQMFVRVSEIMSKPLISLDSKGTLLDAMRVMIKNDIRRLPIVNEGELWGIVTVKDVMNFLASGYIGDVINKGLCQYILQANISKLTTPNPKTVSPDADLSDAVKIMGKHNVGSLVVMSASKPIGILTERDFLLKLPKLRGVEFMTDVSRNRVLVGRIHF